MEEPVPAGAAYRCDTCDRLYLCTPENKPRLIEVYQLEYGNPSSVVEPHPVLACPMCCERLGQ